MTDNMQIWNALCKTDPAHTKSFNRSGGFKGTAIKPIWAVKQMTELFGPCGVGWGMEKPDFTTLAADGDILVYCTVALWYVEPGTQGRRALVYGVGGDKAVAKRQAGSFADDEAFKKSYTDAMSNAMKQIGVGADVHMGLFDDAKYVQEMKGEFAQDDKPKAREQRPAASAAPKTGRSAATDKFFARASLAIPVPITKDTDDSDWPVWFNRIWDAGMAAQTEAELTKLIDDNAAATGGLTEWSPMEGRKLSDHFRTLRGALNPDRAPAA